MKRFRDQRGLPLYNTARGTVDALLLEPPPFNFLGVTARFFPLQASVNILSSFYRSYLDVAPEICTFKPSLPWVLLVILDYGQMATEATNLGWVSQHEIFFGVPLEEWRPDRPGGRPVFQRWVLHTPFILVQNPNSIAIGRQVFGWPKVQAKLRKTRGKWLEDPSDATRLLSLDVRGFSSQQADTIRLLDVDQRLSQNMSLVPLDLQATDLFARLSRWVDLSLSAGLDLAQFLLPSPLSGFGADNPEANREVLSGSLRLLVSLFQEPGVDAVTLKQFPDARDPSQICYESLVTSRLGVTRYNRGGLLGLPNILQGEVNGGFRIRLHQHSAFPIVSSLGLKVARERKIGGRTVSIVEPVFPFWMSVDLNYGNGETICWRTRDTPWYRGRTPVGHPSESAPYNTFAGGGQQVWSGPFFIPRAYWSVFPLRAEESKLRNFVERYLNLGEPFRFKAWGSHVYMIASRSRMFSQVRSAAWIESSQIAFVVPLLCCYEGNELKGVLATMPFFFCDDPTWTTTLQEVLGVPAQDAKIRVLSRFWRREEPPMLEMRMGVFTDIDEGLKAKQRTVLEILRSAPLPGCGSPPPCDPGLHDLARCGAWNELPLNMLSLKQFRDAYASDRACYQALVLEPWLLSNPRRIKPLKPGTAVKIFRYPSIPLAETLGLKPDFVVPPKVAKGAIADVFCPDNPFRMELTIHVPFAEALARTTGFLPWEKGEGAAHEIPKLTSELIEGGPQALVRAFIEQACDPDPEGSGGPMEEHREDLPVNAGRSGTARPRRRRP